MGIVLAAVEEELWSITVVAAASVVEGGGGASSRVPELVEEADKPCRLSAARLTAVAGVPEEMMAAAANVTRRCQGPLLDEDGARAYYLACH